MDDSNGLVKVEKVNDANGNEQLKITPVKEGRGDVRIVIVDSEGNRHEYKIHVINEKSDKVVTNSLTVNNHFFNVGRLDFELPITLGENKSWSIKEGSEFIETRSGANKLFVQVKKDGKAVIEVVDSKTGNRDNYILHINASGDVTQQTIVIGNANPYTLDIPNVTEKPKATPSDLIKSIEKNADGFWVVTPDPSKQGQVVIEAKDDRDTTYTYILEIRQGMNVGVTRQNIDIFEGNSVFIPGGDGFTIEQQTRAGDKDNWIVPANQSDGGWNIQNKVNGIATFRVYGEIAGQKVLVGEYTITADVVGNYPVNVQYKNLANRDYAILTLGDPARNEFVVTDGKDLIEFVPGQNGTSRVEPKPGKKGLVKIEERVEDKGVTRVIGEYVLNIVESVVQEQTLQAKSGSTITIPGLQDRKYEIVEGKDLVASTNGELTTLKPNVDGTVVIEVRNDRGLATHRITIEVAPVEVREETFTLNSNTTVDLTLPSDLAIEKDGKTVDIRHQDGKVVVSPVPGAEGTTTVEVKDTTGNLRYRYIFNVVPVNGDGSNGTRTSKFKVTEGGNFTITRVNENNIRIESGEEFLTGTPSGNPFVVTPKAGTRGNTVTVVEERGDVIVNRYEIEIVAVPDSLKITEERRILDTEVNGRIIPGKGNTLQIRRGSDLVTELPTTPGQLYLRPADPKKTGVVLVEETDSDGNIVRLIELEVPSSSQGAVPEPNVRHVKGADQPYVFQVDGGSNNIEVNMCTGDGSCTILTNGVTRRDNGDFEVDPGALGPDTKTLEVHGIKNGVREPGKITVDVVNVVEYGKNGSSEEQLRCLATLAGMSAPLLLLIPVGILSQVQIPGLEGVSAQINAAIRDANTYIQRGLGIYDQDRAERAAGLQGGFNVQMVNPEFIGLAAGSLGVITAGLLLADLALRSCGQEEMTSSYQLGKAVDNPGLMNASSGSSTSK